MLCAKLEPHARYMTRLCDQIRKLLQVKVQAEDSWYTKHPKKA